MAWVAPTGDARHVPKCGIVCRRFCPGLTQDVITRHQHEQKSLRNGSLTFHSRHGHGPRPRHPSDRPPRDRRTAREAPGPASSIAAARNSLCPDPVDAEPGAAGRVPFQNANRRFLISHDSICDSRLRKRTIRAACNRSLCVGHFFVTQHNASQRGRSMASCTTYHNSSARD